MSENPQQPTDDPCEARAEVMLGWLSREQKRAAYAIINRTHGFPGYEFSMPEDTFDISLRPVLKKMAVAEDAGHVMYTPETVERGLHTAGRLLKYEEEKRREFIGGESSSDPTNILEGNFGRRR